LSAVIEYDIEIGESKMCTPIFWMLAFSSHNYMLKCDNFGLSYGNVTLWSDGKCSTAFYANNTVWAIVNSRALHSWTVSPMKHNVVFESFYKTRNILYADTTLITWLEDFSTVCTMKFGEDRKCWLHRHPSKHVVFPDQDKVCFVDKEYSGPCCRISDLRQYDT